MNQTHPALLREPRDWSTILHRYRDPHQGRSIFEIFLTVILFAACWFAAWLSLQWSYWLTLIACVPAAGLLVRLFMIQHDCGHGTLFRRRRVNDGIGRILGAFTLAPYDHWRHSHNIHHATSGHLGRRGIGDIDTLTVREYVERSPKRRIAYRLYRNPVVMFGIGPAYLFLIQQRLPVGAMRGGWRPWMSTMGTNALVALLVGLSIWTIGLKAFVVIHLPIVLLAASIGVWLFYVQHQFEETFWAEEAAWTMPDAALHGSSHYDLPIVLRWFTANIGIHHVHHLCSRVPFYQLTQVLRAHPELAEIGRLSLMESFRCVGLVLWDEGQSRLISFRQLRQRVA